jgi:flagellar biosynthesis protein FliQ
VEPAGGFLDQEFLLEDSMTPDLVVSILRQTLMAAFWPSAPLLLIGFLAGVVVSLVQIVTSIQDSAFSTVPRLGAFSLGDLLLPWMITRLMTFTTAILGDLGRYAR